MTITTIAHLSDLHFGCIDEQIREEVIRELQTFSPTLLVISGDTVQRPSRKFFRAAQEFLARLPMKTLIVPGNHDIPVFNLFLRFYGAFRRYRRYLCCESYPVYTDKNIVVIGMSSPKAWSLNFVEGGVHRYEVEHVCTLLRDYSSKYFKVLVIHHPLCATERYPYTQVVRGASYALPLLAEAGVDIILSGHLHRQFVAVHNTSQYSILLSHTSTTTSTRLRHEPNGYTWMSVSSDTVSFSARSWRGNGFTTVSRETYCRSLTGWQKQH